MTFEFDSDQDMANRRRHEMSLENAARMDFRTALVDADRRYTYDEARFQAFGVIDARLRVLAFTMRGGALRAISLRKATAGESRRYDEKA